MEGAGPGAAAEVELPATLSGIAGVDAPASIDESVLDADPLAVRPPFSTADSRRIARWMHIVRAPVLLCSLAPVAISATMLWTRGARISVPLLAATLGAAVLVQASASVLDAYLDHLRTQQLVRIDPSSS